MKNIETVDNFEEGIARCKQERAEGTLVWLGTLFITGKRTMFCVTNEPEWIIPTTVRKLAQDEPTGAIGMAFVPVPVDTLSEVTLRGFFVLPREVWMKGTSMTDTLEAPGGLLEMARAIIDGKNSAEKH